MKLAPRLEASIVDCGGSLAILEVSQKRTQLLRGEKRILGTKRASLFPLTLLKILNTTGNT